jgi:hypothetical protein
MEKENTSFISTGMIMLFDRDILFLWIQAFTTVVYLIINRLHSSALNSESPYFPLHETLPLHESSILSIAPKIQDNTNFIKKQSFISL